MRPPDFYSILREFVQTRKMTLAFDFEGNYERPFLIARSVLQNSDQDQTTR